MSAHQLSSSARDLLSVPVVDLVDVPEDDLVFSFHVVRDALLLDPPHEALQVKDAVSLHRADEGGPEILQGSRAGFGFCLGPLHSKV